MVVKCNGRKERAHDNTRYLILMTFLFSKTSVVRILKKNTNTIPKYGKLS